MTKPFPTVSKALVDELERIYSGKLPRTLQAPDEIARLIGQQDIVLRLRVEYERQQADIIKQSTSL